MNPAFDTGLVVEDLLKAEYVGLPRTINYEPDELIMYFAVPYIQGYKFQSSTVQNFASLIAYLSILPSPLVK